MSSNHPNSLKNLRPFQPGNKGGPGTFRLPAELRQARRENMESLIKLLHLYVGMSPEEAKERLAGPYCIQLEEMVQGQIDRAKEGDSKSFQFLIEIMCGKIPEADENHTSDSLSPKEKIEHMKKAIAILEAKVGTGTPEQSG